jgi:adenosylcobinamide-GDP ribazoletransferase
MWHELCLLLMAVQRLTRLPAPRWLGAPEQWRAEWRRDSLRHDPAVGLLVGACGAAVLWAAAHAWPALLSVLVSMAATLWLTAARNERALATAIDGATGVGVPALGAAGAIALLVTLALKAAALHGLATRDLDAALVALPLAHTGSRAAVLVLMRSLPGATPAIDGLSLGIGLVWAMVMAAAASVFIPWSAIALAALAMTLCGVLAARRLHEGAGGNANTLGAAQQACELAASLALLAVLARG